MPGEPPFRSGARKIVQACLDLEPNQQFVIFADETTIEPAVVIAEAAESVGVLHTVIVVPVSTQHRIPLERDLSYLTQEAAREARAILTCVNSSPECLPFRQRILETHWTARTRIGHMPGATLEVLEMANADLEQLVIDCGCMEIAMARGKKLELTSYAADGSPHTLSADIGGWERLPVASDGVIRDGAWGNVPSGETYIAPMEGTGEGSVVINGSIPGLVIEPGAELGSPLPVGSPGTDRAIRQPGCALVARDPDLESPGGGRSQLVQPGRDRCWHESDGRAPHRQHAVRRKSRRDSPHRPGNQYLHGWHGECQHSLRHGHPKNPPSVSTTSRLWSGAGWPIPARNGTSTIARVDLEDSPLHSRSQRGPFWGPGAPQC